ncbi:riboflavin synthase [Galactobacter valiniphilus]|uniref:riboflavin synthase n=1 Tax=Galactobacter valiniphilus TaxID=2676122 RepID=UPI003736EF7C
MFTGIIEASGSVVSLDFTAPSLARLTVAGPAWLGTAPLGSSIAVDGACLTVIGRDAAGGGASASFEVTLETLELTSLGALAPGHAVNLERALAADGRLDGHVVQGHVDGVGELLERTDEPGDARLRVSLPVGLAGLVAKKGSIALSGVSLTVAEVSAPHSAEAWFEVALIPATLEATTLGTAVPGERLNLEADVLARYAARLADVAVQAVQG